MLHRPGVIAIRQMDIADHQAHLHFLTDRDCCSAILRFELEKPVGCVEGGAIVAADIKVHKIPTSTA